MKLQSLDPSDYLDNDKFIFCLEAVPDIEKVTTTEVVKNLEQLVVDYGVASIYKTCDTIEGLRDNIFGNGRRRK